MLGLGGQVLVLYVSLFLVDVVQQNTPSTHGRTDGRIGKDATTLAQTHVNRPQHATLSTDDRTKKNNYTNQNKQFGKHVLGKPYHSEQPAQEIYWHFLGGTIKNNVTFPITLQALWLDQR